MRKFYQYLFVLPFVFLSFAGSMSAQTGNNCANAIPFDVVVNACEFQQVSNVGLTNSGQFPTSCPGFAGGDLWLSVVMPPSGEVTARGQLLFPGGNFAMDINMAVYSGSCGSLTQVGCDQDSGSGTYPQLTFSGTPGSTMYIQLWDIGNNQQAPFNFCVNGTATCTSPTVSFAEVCDGNNEYSVNVNITNLGDAPSLNITNNGGAAPITGITSTGVVNVGPFALGDEVTVTVEHADDASCNVSTLATDVGLACDYEINCGVDLNQTYCYRNNDNTAFLYSSPDNSPITITFNSGLIQSPQDRIRIRDGNNGSAPLLFNGSNGGNLAGLTRTASSGSIWLEVASDIGGSCNEGSLGLGGGWDWDVTCEGLSACESAASVTSQTTFAASEISANLSGVPFSGASQCAGPGNNPDLWFSFTAVGSVQYFRVNASGDFNPAVEVYDACGGEQLACVDDAGAGLRELFWLTDLTIGAAYVYRVYHAGGSPASTTQFETAVAHIPTVQLRAQDCGATGLASNSIIRSNFPSPNFLLQNFEYEFTELEAPFNTYNVVSPNGPNPQFIMQWFPQVESGRSYDVRVRCRMYQGPNWGEFGPTCTITMGGAPASGLQSQFNNGFFQFCDQVAAIPVSGSTNYRWVFTNVEGSIEYNTNTGSQILPLQNVAGLEYGSSYAVEVFVTQPGGVESVASGPGVINMVNSVPNTRLNPNSNVACGSTVPISTWTQALNVCAATSYTFRFTNLSQPELPNIEVTRSNRVISFGSVNGLLPGNTYNVAVRADAGGISGDYSIECEVTFAGDSGFGLDDNDEVDGISVVDQPAFNIPNTEINVKLYPNPVSQGNEVNVAITNITEASSNLEVNIFDLTGKLLVQERFGVNAGAFNATVNLEGRIATGVYIVQTRIDGVVTDTQKLILE